MKKKLPKDKMKKKITITLDDKVKNALEQYINDNDIYNRSELIEKLIKTEIKKDK